MHQLLHASLLPATHADGALFGLAESHAAHLSVGSRRLHEHQVGIRQVKMVFIEKWRLLLKEGRAHPVEQFGRRYNVGKPP